MARGPFLAPGVTVNLAEQSYSRQLLVERKKLLIMMQMEITELVLIYHSQFKINTIVNVFYFYSG